MRGHQLADDEAGDHDDRDQRESDDETGPEPVVFLAFVEQHLKRADADRKHADAPIIDFARAPLDPRRVEDKGAGHQNRHDTDRDIDVEDPAPAIRLRQPAAEHGAENRRDYDAQSPKPHGLAAILRRESFEQDRLRQRLQASARRALKNAEYDESKQTWSETAQK